MGMWDGACKVPTLREQLLMDGGVEPRGTSETPRAVTSFLIGAKTLSLLVV